jgi:preprotein translocase subunit SecE
MASVTTNDGGKTMASDLIVPGADEPRQPSQPSGPKPSGNDAGGGFFSVYKSGQGYWTRMATAIGAVLVIGMTAAFIWQQLPAWIDPLAKNHKLLFGLVAVFVAGSALLVWRLMNKPTNADFLIATDSEMKKVNWTSRKELIGSTKVVIFFMFFIAFLLFFIDIVFGYLFYLFGILANPPF